MQRLLRQGFLLALVWVCLLAQPAWAAPALNAIRYHAAGETVRVVLDLSEAAAYSVRQSDDALSIIVELDNTALLPQLKPENIKHPAVVAVKPAAAGEKTRVVIECLQPVGYKAFALANPSRIVVDLTRIGEKKSEQEIAPGIRYTSWYKTNKAGALNVHILDISSQSGYTLEPVLAKQSQLGIAPLTQAMSYRSDSVAAVNASYFAANGDIIGLLKMDDEIVSSTPIARTALGIGGDGRIRMDQVGYRGEVELPAEKVALSAVNESRGPNGLILYNRYWGPFTRTNGYGTEITVVGGVVTAVTQGNSPIPANGYVLSAHGEAALKLGPLRPGDPVTLLQTLGAEWDQSLHVVGAGPMLVKQGNVFITTKLEEFGNDVAGGRAPRTAVGLTADGRILLVVVDGRQAMSSGMSLLELALFMRELGADTAMNLDGGGSSEMIVKGRIVNKPSDGKERRVGNALAVVPKATLYGKTEPK
ncbi:MAG: phosphodiester glycosidase family protein [Sporomusaceae bacterium]|nr:phosphodiester glycosidase family protein [Sporomusaceae bacterium]